MDRPSKRIVKKSICSTKRLASILDSFHHSERQALASVDLLLRASNKLLQAEKVRECKQTTRMIFLLNESRRLGLLRYDVFHIGGYRPTEDDLSNAIASLLDPNAPHGLERKPLQRLLQNTITRYPSQRRRIHEILSALNGDAAIRVTLRPWSQTTIPDIVIEGKSFLIFIENKLSGGTETYCNRLSQTKREWSLLQRQAMERGIPSSRTLALYLSPQGKSSVCPQFLPISVGLVVTSIRQSLSPQNSVHDLCRNASIGSFLDFYHNY